MTGYWKISYEETARSMKAIVNDTYGSADDLELRELETPAAGPDGVLVRVRAAAVNPLDWRLMRGKPFIGRLFFGLGLRRPKRRVPGVDVAGRVEAVGENVTQLEPGDEVFGGTEGGAFAEFVRGTEKDFVPKPTDLTFEQAAAISVAGVTALQGLRDHGRLQSRQRVLINGAG